MAKTNETKIWYLCDGKKTDCKKKHCYKNTDDDPCKHTRDINHAVNFEKRERAGCVSYWEKPPQP